MLLSALTLDIVNVTHRISGPGTLDAAGNKYVQDTANVFRLAILPGSWKLPQKDLARLASFAT